MRVDADVNLTRAVGAVLLGIAVLAGPTGCESEPHGDPPPGPFVTSPAFDEGEPIPEKYTCDGANRAPPLAWRSISNQARSSAIVVDDPDAPGGTYVHWIVAGLDPTVRRIAEAELPAGAWEAPNSADERAYTGPCPPSGTHHYRFTVYQLLAAPDRDADRDDVLAQIDEQAISHGRLTGTYSRN